MSLDFAAVLTKMVEVRASDVHLTAGFPPAGGGYIVIRES